MPETRNKSFDAVFIGSDEISCGFLRALLTAADITVKAVITQPDRPSGRHLKLRPCPLRSMILERSLPVEVLTPEKINTPDSLDAITALNPDIIVLVAYGQFLGRKLLSIPRLGCLNMHLSALPLLRGAAPITRAILEGHSEAGVTAMMMDPGMDSGDIVAMLKTPITDKDTRGTLTDRLVEIGGGLMLESVRALRDGTALRQPQDSSKATFAPKIGKDECIIDWSWPAERICRTIRAFSPKPGCTTFMPAPDGGIVNFQRPGCLLKVFGAEIVTGIQDTVRFGTVISMNDSPVIYAGDGNGVRLLEVRPEGKPRSMTGREFSNGYGKRIKIGDHFFPGLSFLENMIGV